MDAIDLSFLEQQVLWGVSVGRLILSGLLLLLGILAYRFVRRVLGGLLKRFNKSGDVDVIDDVNRLLTKPLSLLINVVLWNGVIGLLALPQEPLNVRSWLSIAGAVVVLLVALYCAFHIVDVFAGIARRAAKKTETRLDDQLIPPVTNAVKLILVLVAMAAILGKFDVSAAGLIASLSIGGLALAFAAKDTLANVFGSLVIFSERPFQIGDVIDVDGVNGVVEEVGVRSTHIRKFDKTVSILPNQTFTNAEICNLSKRDARRIRFEVTFTHEVTSLQLEQFLSSVRESLDQRTDIHSDQSLVRLTNMNTNGLVVLVLAFTKSTGYDEYMLAQEEILLGVRKLAEEQELPIMPAKEIHLSGQPPK
ncbi:MAG: mechanosensitive ion channel [Bacteroidota bacterium]|nr:mechanosensitive ion channel [Bacteroidota bacterium]